MKSAVFDIIILLSEAAAHDDSPEDMIDNLLLSNFALDDIKKALNWRNSFFEAMPMLNSLPACALRIYSHQEREVLGEAGLEFICYLEDEGLLDEVGREFIVRHAKMLDVNHLPLPYVVWMVYVLLDKRGDRDYAEFLAGLMSEMVATK